MTILDVYHWADFFVAGSGSGDAVVDAVYHRWRREFDGASADNLQPAILRASLSEHSRAVLWDEAHQVLLRCQPTTKLHFSTDAPRDEGSREVWGPALGAVVDKLLEDSTVDSWLLTCDEGYCVGYWQRLEGGGFVNSVGGRDGYSLRPDLTLMLMDRFDSAGIAFRVCDLGDLPGGVSTADEN